jgi:hypothetical protein
VNLCDIHCNRVPVQPKDIQLARILWGDRGADKDNQYQLENTNDLNLT